MSNEIVGPYSFGEEWIREKEKQAQTNILFQQKKAAVQPAQIDRAKDLATKYPTAMKGLISNAVNKGFTDKQVEDLLRLQYQAVPKSQPYNPNPVGNDITNAYIPIYGDVYEVKQASKNFRTEPVYGTLKGIARVAMLGAEGLWNVTMGRTGRAFVKTAESYEKPFQAQVQSMSKKEQELIEQHKAGDPNVTLYDIAALRDQQEKTEKTGRVTGAALALTALLSGRSYGHSKMTRESFFDNWKDAGSSWIGESFSQAREGMGFKEVWKSLGDGFIPSGPIVAKAQADQEAFKYRGRNITIGRYIEDVIGIDPNSALYGGVSGVIDFYNALAFDPALVATKSVKAINYSKSVMGKINKAFTEGDFGKIADEIDIFLTSPKSNKHLDALAESKDFKQIFDSVKDTDMALQLLKTNTRDEVTKVVRDYVIKNQSIGLPKVTRTINSIGYNKNLLKAIGSRDKGFSKFGEWTPTQDSLFKDTNGGVANYSRWLASMEIPRNEANKLLTDFAEASVKGDQVAQKNVLYKDTLLQLTNKLEKDGFSKLVTDQLKLDFAEFQGILPTGKTVGKTYWAKLDKTAGGNFLNPIEATFKGQRSIPIEGLNNSVTLPTPFDIGQHMDEVWSLGNPKDLKRTIGTFNKYATLPEFKIANMIDNTAIELPKGLTTPIDKILGKSVPQVFKGLKKGRDQLVDVAWNLQKKWTGAQLVTRVAWPLRIFAESQFRMGLAGLDNWFENPMAMWVWGNYTYDLAGTPMKVGKGAKGVAYGAGVEKIVARRASSIFGKQNQASYINNTWDRIVKQDADKAGYIKSWQVNLKWPLESDLGKAIANDILEGTDLAATKNSFWSGDLKKIREQLNDVKYDNKGNRTRPYTSLEDANTYVDNYREWIMDLTKGDEDVLKMIRDRRIVTADGDILPLDNIDRFTKNNIQEIRKFLDTKYDVAPDVLASPKWATEQKALDESFEASQYLWYWLGEAPDAALNRIPTYTQYYWTSVGQLIPFADEAALKHFDKLSKAGDLPPSVKQIYEAGKRSAIKKYGSIADAVKANPEAKLSIDEISEASKAFSLDAHNTLLYNLSEKGFFAEATRLIFPFFEPWKEVALNYPRLFAKNPAGLRKIQMLTAKGQQSGILYRDPTIDELFYVAPMTDMQENLFGIELPESVDVQQVSPLAGANLFTASYYPGFGPVVQLSVKALDKYLPKTNEWQDIEDQVFPYGLGGRTVSDTLGGLLPTYLDNAINAYTEGLINKNAWYDQVADATKILTVSWNEGMLDYDPRTKEGRKQFEEDAIVMAKKLTYHNSLAKFYQPSSPREQVRIGLETPGFLNPLLVEDIFRTYLPEDMSFGKYDDDLFNSVVITALYAQAYEAVEPGDEYLATQLIASLIGGTPDDWDDIYTAAYLVQGKTTTKGKKLPSTEGEVRFEREWPEYAEKYSSIFPYFAPVVEEYDMLDINSFYNQIEEGERVNLTTQQMLERAQERAFKVIFNHRTKPFRDRRDSQAVAERARIQAELLQQFPYGLGRDIATYGGDISQEEMFAEIKEAAADSWITENTEAGQGLKLFFYGDENNKGLLDALDEIKNYEPLVKTTEDGTKVYYTDAQALSYLQKNKKAQVGRNILLKWAQQITKKHPEFGALFKEKLLGYVELTVTEDKE